MTSIPTASWYRAHLTKIGTAHLCLLEAPDDELLGHIERIAAQPACIDLAWLDRAPFLARLRAEPRFAAARAIVAARVAALEV
jgi:hypothetical protein